MNLGFAGPVSSSLPVDDPLPPSETPPVSSESSGTELPKSGDQVGNIELALKDAGMHRNLDS